MHVRLTHIDGKLPNLALMKIRYLQNIISMTSGPTLPTGLPHPLGQGF